MTSNDNKSKWKERKKSRHFNAKNFTISVLDFFLSIPESILNGFDRGEFYRLMNGHSSEIELTCSNICNFLHSLKKRGYVEIIKSEKGESVIFTNKARMAVVDQVAGRAKTNNNCVFVSFDIPEIKRTNRNHFRRFIKRLGFKQIQKSLWVHNKLLGELIELAAEEYQVSEFVVYISAGDTNINEYIVDKLKSD